MQVNVNRERNNMRCGMMVLALATVFVPDYSGLGAGTLGPQDGCPSVSAYGLAYGETIKALQAAKDGLSETNHDKEVGVGITKHIFAGAERIATVKPNGDVLYYMTDHLGSSTLITDDTGDVVQRMDYEPYGDLMQNSLSGNPTALRHTYTGQEADLESGLMYYGARYYDPVVGSFTTADPLPRSGTGNHFYDSSGGSSMPAVAGFPTSGADPRFLNPYAYATGSPVNFVDPSGHQAEQYLLPPAVILLTNWDKGRAWGGCNYLGPDTDYEQYRAQGVEPTSPIDGVAMEHDRRYGEGGFEWNDYVIGNPSDEQRMRQVEADMIFARDATKAYFNINSWNTPDKYAQTSVFGPLGSLYFLTSSAINLQQIALHSGLTRAGQGLGKIGMWNSNAAGVGAAAGQLMGTVGGWAHGDFSPISGALGYQAGGMIAGTTVGGATTLGQGLTHAAGQLRDEARRAATIIGAVIEDIF